MAKSKTKVGEETTEMIVIDPTTVLPEQLKAKMATEMEKRKVLTDYISKNLKEGEDYGKIKIGNVDSKNTLFKPGSEKFCSLFGITPKFKQDKETVEMLGNKPGIVAYICELYTKDGRIVGEGRGVASMEEKRWTMNNMVKIAEKRAQIDAVLRTGALSDFFTQDIEDGESKPEEVENLNKITQKQIAMIFKILPEIGRTKQGFEQWILKEFNIIGIENLTIQQASRVIDAMMKMPKVKPKEEDMPVIQRGDEITKEDIDKEFQDL